MRLISVDSCNTCPYFVTRLLDLNYCNKLREFISGSSSIINEKCPLEVR